jgi:Zinc knuckle
MSKQIYELDTNKDPCKGTTLYCGSTKCAICLRKLREIVMKCEGQLMYGNDTRLAAKGQGLCYYCKRRGHLAKDCNVLSKHREHETCGACNEQGHVTKYCQKKTPLPPTEETDK